MARKEVKAQVEEYAARFRPYYGQNILVQIEPSNVKPFSSQLRTVRVATLTDAKGLEPDKRTVNDKDITPPFFMVDLEDGKLFFIIEDVKEVVVNTRGVILRMGDYEVRFLCE
jgi:hypothetical protein